MWTRVQCPPVHLLQWHIKALRKGLGVSSISPEAPKALCHGEWEKLCLIVVCIYVQLHCRVVLLALLCLLFKSQTALKWAGGAWWPRATRAGPVARAWKGSRKTVFFMPDQVSALHMSKWTHFKKGLLESQMWDEKRLSYCDTCAETERGINGEINKYFIKHLLWSRSKRLGNVCPPGGIIIINPLSYHLGARQNINILGIKAWRLKKYFKKRTEEGEWFTKWTVCICHGSREKESSLAG